jgi:hypothetical protein
MAAPSLGSNFVASVQPAPVTSAATAPPSGTWTYQAAASPFDSASAPFSKKFGGVSSGAGPPSCMKAIVRVPALPLMSWKRFSPVFTVPAASGMEIVCQPVPESSRLPASLSPILTATLRFSATNARMWSAVAPAT